MSLPRAWQGEDIPSVMSEYKVQVIVETQAFRARRLVEVPQPQIEVASRVYLGLCSTYVLCEGHPHLGDERKHTNLILTLWLGD